MDSQFRIDILSQPDDTTCGPTCLQAVYQYYEDPLALQRVISEVESLDHGGTLAVSLGAHALKRGYSARIYTNNLKVFDPTWFKPGSGDLGTKLLAQEAVKKDPKLQTASRSYREFLQLGGQIRYLDLTAGLIRRYLKKSIPILTGLSATYLYNCAREIGTQSGSQYDDIQGEPVGHFVVLCGYDSRTREVQIADPLHSNPLSNRQLYAVTIERLISSILLGIVTHDANLLIITPRNTLPEPPS